GISEFPERCCEDSVNRKLTLMQVLIGYFSRQSPPLITQLSRVRIRLHCVPERAVRHRK
ncbi:hypothetical protein LOAG_17172, partial [Loa loa]